ncbi:MAG TPA: hypothetical protein VHY80_06360 [Stellaceae bacterium]|nr:hypothetical protein [Stellaceae bacterium]
MIRAIMFVFALSIAALSALTPARASGPFLPAIRFYSASGIDADSDTAYFKGRIGIIRPSFGENRLYAAYRILLGHPFTDAQAQLLMATCCDIRPADTANTMQNTWLDIRATITPDKPNPDLNPFRPTKDYQDFLNCFPSAFETAAAALKARIASYGAKDRSVTEWVKGQDAVFVNCSKADLSLPADLTDAPGWLKADRAYQQAAAYFYHWDYAAARQRFAAIAQDASSPWAPVAPYLMARASLRLATAAKTPDAIAQARQDIAAVKPNAGISAADVAKLSSAFAFLQPDQRIDALEKLLLAPELPDDLATDVHDFFLLADAKNAPSTDLGDWADVMEASNSDADSINTAKKSALANWKQTPTLPWLIAALTFLSPNDTDAASAIEQSRKLDPTSPGFLDAAWQRLRLLIGQGQSDTARIELDTILADPSLSTGTRNLFLIERARAARDWDDFARFLPRRGEFLGPYFGDPSAHGDVYPALPIKSISKEYASMLGWRSELMRDPRYFDTDGATIINTEAPLAVQAKFAADPALPDNMRRDLALAAWTRAVLLGNDAIAKPLAEILAAAYPQYAGDWQRYRDASAADERKFAAALLLLRFPAAEPWLEDNLGYTYKRDVIGTYASRWWSPDGLKTSSEAAAAYFTGPCPYSCATPGWLGPPSFVSATDLRTARDEFARLRQSAGSAADYLGGMVLDWAKTHPDDPRVPEALHLVVRLTQYGDAGTNGVSRRAYNLLRASYPKSPWTKQTPYWFGK